jgi:hypothetical protein
VLEAELNAVLEGVLLALHWFNKPLVIEMDCLEILNILKKDEVDWSAYSSIIEEIKTLIKGRHPHVKIYVRKLVVILLQTILEIMLVLYYGLPIAYVIQIVILYISE